MSFLDFDFDPSLFGGGSPDTSFIDGDGGGGGGDVFGGDGNVSAFAGADGSGGGPLPQNGAPSGAPGPGPFQDVNRDTKADFQPSAKDLPQAAPLPQDNTPLQQQAAAPAPVQPVQPPAAPPPQQTIPTSTGPVPVAPPRPAMPPPAAAPPPVAPPPPVNAANMAPMAPASASGAGTGARTGVLGSFLPGKPNSSFGSWLFGGDDRSARQFIGSLGAGLTAAGNSAGKSKMQALSSGAGAALTAGQKADDTGTEQQRKDTDQALGVAKLNETQRRNDQVMAWHMEQMRQKQMLGTVQSRADAWRNSDLGKITTAEGDINKKEANLRQERLYDLKNAPDAETRKQINTEIQNDLEQYRQRLYKDRGINPESVQKTLSQGRSYDNPHKPTTWDEFNAVVRPGQFYYNPADKKVYQRSKPAPPPSDYGRPTTAGGAPSFIDPNTGVGPNYTPDQDYALAG